MRLIFAGTPDFAAVHLSELLEKGYTPVCVYTQPDRPAGRGHKLTPSPVKSLALAHQIPVRTPLNFKDPQDVQEFLDLQADLCVVVAYGIILPAAIVHGPRLGCINVHGSLLPKYRGAAPVQRALLEGESQTGVSIMQLTEQLDAGGVFKTASLPILAEDTSETLFTRLALLGAQTLSATLPAILEGRLSALPQDEAQVSYARKITKEEAALDYSTDAAQLSRIVRGMQPWPVAHTTLQQVTYKVFQAFCLEDGEHEDWGVISGVNKEGITVTCRRGSLQLQIIQAPGKKPVKAADLARSCPQIFTVGKHFDRF